MWAPGPPSSSAVTVSPVICLITSGPVMNIRDASVWMMKSVSAGEYAAPPAQGPAMIEICGTAPDSATFWKNTLPQPDSESMPSWTRAPPESLKQTNGVPFSRAARIAVATLIECISPAEPPATLKSWLATCTGRPSTAAAPVTTPSAGMTAVSIPNNVVRCLASIPNSSKLSGSTSSAIRSRAFSLPAACCLACRFSPPPAMTSSRRVRSSVIRSCIVMGIVRVGRLDIAEVTFLEGLHCDGVLLAVDSDLVLDRDTQGARLGVGDHCATFCLELGRVLAKVQGTVWTGGEEARRHLRKHGEGQHVLVRAIETVDRFGLGPEGGPFVGDEVSRTRRDGLLAGLGLGQGDNLGVLVADGEAVVPEHQVGELARHHLVLTHHHVEHGLGAHDLA